jgi:hypothetical protein
MCGHDPLLKLPSRSPAAWLALAIVAGCGSGGDSSDVADVPDVLDDRVGDVEDVVAPDDVAAEEAEEDVEPPEDVLPDVPEEAEVEPDAPDADDVPDAPPAYVRGSLAGCLLDPGCNRVLIESHMGAWTAAIPGNSMGAYRRAWDLGADAIEADVNVSMDGVPFMIHDDTITLYESLLCAGRVISESLASEIDGCLLAPSLTETIPTFDEFVEWARGKVVIHLDVKDNAAVATMIGEIHDHGAEDFVFIAIGTGEAATAVPAMPGSESVYFVLRVGSVLEVDLALADLRRPNIFLLEGDRSWPDTGVDETAMLDQVARVHAAGLRIMASSDQYLATVADHQHLFDMGFDMVLSYNCENGVTAARAENAARGLPP